jgi:CRISPR-associated protein Csm1
MITSSQVALQVAQEAISVLAQWAEIELPEECQCPDDNDAIAQAKKLLLWSENAEPKPLRLLFDQVKLSPGQTETHYWKAEAIANDHPLIPYPQPEEPTAAELECLKLHIQDEISQLKFNQQDWQNLSLLTLILEKFGSHLSIGESDIALVDMARSAAALAAALTNYPAANQLSLIAGDLSGIQNFIYTISSDGALKSLRARSFYLELVTEEVVQQLLAKLQLPRTNVIYAGGGNLYLLADGTEETRNTVKNVRQQLNKWLWTKFQGKVFLALYCFPSEPEDENFVDTDVATDKFANYWEAATRKVAKQKSRKFVDQIAEFIKQRDSHTPCKVCHRDDIKEEELQPLHEDNPILVCEVCYSMFDLGGRLFGVKAIVRSHNEALADGVPTLSFKLPATDQLPASQVYYYLFNTWKPIVQNTETVFLVNDWTIEHYRFRHFRNPVPLLLGNYGKKSEVESGFIRAGEMAEVAEGINRVGYLRMDVDRLGQIFAKGLDKYQRFLKFSGLSRQMSYFFKVYLNSLAENRLENLFPIQKPIKTLSKQSRKNLLFIYAGGDDLFISGAWNEIIEFAFDVYQCFRAYTGQNPDITLSGGISLADVKFPLYQAAAESGEAEEVAKGNGRDSLGLFGEKFKWSEWLGESNVSIVESREQKYWEQIAEKPDKPKLLGVFPFVDRLKQKQIDLNYSRSFVRNLLLTAQIQEQMIKEIEEKRKPQQYEYQTQDIRYYLHLPQIAYTLARLPKEVFNDEDFRKSLKSPYNAPYFRAIATWIELLTRQSQL